MIMFVLETPLLKRGVSSTNIIIGGGTRGAGGATPPPPPPPPDFKINQNLTNTGWKSLLSMYYSFSSVTFMRVFARGTCPQSMQGCPFYFAPPPPQVVTCSSASDNTIPPPSPRALIHTPPPFEKSGYGLVCMIATVYFMNK